MEHFRGPSKLSCDLKVLSTRWSVLRHVAAPPRPFSSRKDSNFIYQLLAQTVTVDSFSLSVEVPKKPDAASGFVMSQMPPVLPRAMALQMFADVDNSRGGQHALKRPWYELRLGWVGVAGRWCYLPERGHNSPCIT
ncbi:hypothetical protein E2C01_048882 [Portunus trituberculatus]|uniref:Uncharacterized protein n=1 Tax=Portunus trituberculatus TaxID=210409 RepID=A0A5B7G7K5_PORTR|nr:hypothetical protein [Portunus trituberculatus]